jgi:phosphohistidine phosphatase
LLSPSPAFPFAIGERNAATADHASEEAFPARSTVHRCYQRRKTAPDDRDAPTVTAVKVYLVQHGHAKPDDEDPQRPLTARGADDVTWVAHWAIDRFGVRPSRIVHSDKTRARRTAEIWGRLTGVEPEEGDGPAPNDDLTTWVRRAAAETADLMLVGHLPHLANVASLLLTGDADRQLVGFRHGGLVAVEHDLGWTATLVLPPPAA